MLTKPSKIVSLFIIQRPHIMTADEKAARSALMAFPSGLNKELAAEFQGITRGLRGRNGFDPERNYSKITRHFFCPVPYLSIELFM
jgi:hypothetical protein